jgi:hypothetical protein
METQNALANVDFSQLPAQVGTDDFFEGAAKATRFLGRLQLIGKGAYVDRGLIKPGHWGIPVSKEEVVDLGPSIDILPLARRSKAIDMSDKPVITSYDETSETFQTIMADSDNKVQGCQYGPSFLILERSTGRFLEYFVYAPTHRPEAAKIYPFLPIDQARIDRLVAANKPGADKLVPHGPLPVTLKTKYIEKAFSWFVPVAVECSVPFKSLPDGKQIMAELTKFLTDKGGKQEEASGEGGEGAEKEKPASKKSSRVR